MVNRRRLLDSFSSLVSIDSVSLQERQMADYLKNALTDLGLTVQEDDSWKTFGGTAGNVYGFLPGALDLPALLFSAHMDTVTPGLGKKAIFQEDGRITSDGATILGADDASGIAAILEAIRVIKENGLPHRPIEVLFTASEEVHCHGTAAFDPSILQSKETYVLDLGGHIGTAACSAPAICSFTATVKGRAAHAGVAPEQGIHAIRAAAAAISQMPLGRVDEMTINVGAITGGEATNIVPHTCVVEGEIRGFHQDTVLAKLAEIRACFQDAATDIGATVEWEQNASFNAYAMEETHPAVTRFCAACESLNLPISLIPTYGGSDLNNLYSLGLRGLVISTGMENAHNVTEYIHADDLERAANLTLALMTSLD